MFEHVTSMFEHNELILQKVLVRRIVWARCAMATAEIWRFDRHLQRSPGQAPEVNLDPPFAPRSIEQK
jgi:hypothetical protein